MKEHRPTGWGERHRDRERVSVCVAREREREDRKAAEELEGDDRVGAIEC